MNNELVVDETTTATEGTTPNGSENSPDSAPVVAALPENSAPIATVIPKRRGRPPGSGRKATDEKPVSTKKAPRASKAVDKAPGKLAAKAKKIASSTDAAFAVLQNLAGDELAVAVHSASSTARMIIAQLLKAGI